jgi:hypothetical protein
MRKPETRLVHQIMEALEKAFPGIYLRKIHGNPYQHAGIPDLVGCVEGYFVGLEVKTDDGKTSLIQELEGKSIKKAWGIHGVVTSPEEAIILVANSIEGKITP